MSAVDDLPPRTAAFLSRIRNTDDECDFMAQLERELLAAQVRIAHLEGIIARNAMQRLDDTRLHITPQDIADGIEIARAYRIAQSAFRNPHSAISP